MATTEANGAPAGAAAPVEPSPEELVARVQALTERLEEIGDYRARESAEELVGAVIELYGAGLERIFAAIDESGEDGAELRERLTSDGVVASLMLIHDLYPVDLTARVMEALDSVRPYLESHGGDVELLSVEGGIAALRLQGSCKTCPASSATLELAVKQALEEQAPDLEGMTVEGISEQPDPVSENALELPMVQVSSAGTPPLSSWVDLDGAADVPEGKMMAANIAGVEIALARIDGTLLAYQDSCSGCGRPISEGSLSGSEVRCTGCERAFDLPRAGKVLGDELLQLEPVPLLDDADGTRVAVAATA